MNFGNGTISPASYVVAGVAGGKKGNAPTSSSEPPPPPKCVPAPAVTCE